MKKLVFIILSLSFSSSVFSQKAINIQVISKGNYNDVKKTWSWDEPKRITGFTVTISKDYVRFNSNTKDENGKYAETFIVISTKVIDELVAKTNTSIILHNSKGEKLLMGLCNYKNEELMDEIVVITGDTAIKYYVNF